MKTMTPPIKAVNVDSLFELSRIIMVARDLKVRANIALRVVPEVDSPTSPGNRTGSEGTKFGIRQSELALALGMVRAAGDAVVATGLHGHIGSQIVGTAPFELAAACLAAFASLALRFVGADIAPALSLLAVIALGIGGAFASALSPEPATLPGVAD